MCTFKEAACKIFINRCHCVVLWLEAGDKLGQKNLEESCSGNFYSKIRKKKTCLFISRPSLAWGKAQCELHQVLTKVRPPANNGKVKGLIPTEKRGLTSEIKRKKKVKCK